MKFYVTRIGCGIAGFKDDEIAPLFNNALGIDNIILPKSFAEAIEPKFPFDIASFEEAINWTLPGLQLFYRDTNVDGDLDQLAQVYKDKNIIRAGFFIDCTSRAAKPVNMDLVKVARMSFDNMLKMEPLPWLESEAWNDRTSMLPGTSSDGWATLEPQDPINEQVANLHNAILSMSHDDTELNKP